MVTYSRQADTHRMKLCKVYRVTTFVPPDRLDALLNGVQSELPLRYGRYDHATWWSAVGTEQFRPLPGANPTHGAVGQVQRVPTVRIEFVIPRDPTLLTHLISGGIRPNHPWEEPAVFIDKTEITLAGNARSIDAGPKGARRSRRKRSA
jgi:hypothetical protein